MQALCRNQLFLRTEMAQMFMAIQQLELNCQAIQVNLQQVEVRRGHVHPAGLHLPKE